MKTTRLWLFLSFFLLAGCAAAARVLYPVSDDPLKAKPGAYTLDPTHANIIFAVDHLGFSLHHGRFNRIEGSLLLEEEAPEKAQLFITIETGSIDTNNADLDAMLRAQSMFDTATFPKASFESTGITLTSEKSATIHGVLTLKGIQRETDIQAQFIGGGINPLTGKATLGFSGSAVVKRSEFGLTEWLPWVGDDVKLILEAEFVRDN